MHTDSEGLHSMSKALHWMQETLGPDGSAAPSGNWSADWSYWRIISPESGGDILDRLLNFGELLTTEDRDNQVLVNFSPDRSRRNWRYFYSARLEAASTFSVADSFVRRAPGVEGQALG